jgi:hypothetical protein
MLDEKEIYKGIDDMPQAVWRQLEKTDDLRLIYKEPRKVTRRHRKALETRRQEIRDEYFNEIAMNADLEAYIMKLVKREILRTKISLKSDNYLSTLYMKIDLEIKALSSKNTSSDKKYYENKAILTKYMGGSYIDENKVSVREYDSYMKMLIKESERATASSKIN